MTKGIYFTFFVILAGLILRQPAAATGALICTWALDQWAGSQDQYFFVNHGLTSWLTSLALLAALAIRAIKGKPIIRPVCRSYVLTFCMYGMVLLTLLWTTRPTDSIEQLGNNYRVIILFGFLLPLSISDLSDLKAMFYTILTVGFAISVLVLATGTWQGRTLKYETGGVIIGEGIETGNPLAIATNGAYVAIIAMLMNFRGVARIWQLLRYAVIASAFAVSVKSGSRGQTVAILFCTLCFLPYSRRFKDLRSFLALAISLSLFGLVTLYLLSTLTGSEEAGGQLGRRWTWDGFVGEYEQGRIVSSMKLIYAWIDAGPFYWLMGLGTSAAFDPKICGFYPHMVFAETLGEEGFIGWIILWMFPFAISRDLRESWHYVKDDPEERGLMATMGALVLFEVMMSFKQGSLLGSGPAFAIITMLGRVTLTLRARSAELTQLQAGMYPMSPEDWDDTEEPYQVPVGGVLAQSM